MLAESIANVIAPVCLADYTRPALIAPWLHERDATGIISELSHVLLRGGAVQDLLPFYHAALNQELMANSVQQCGIAFPHGRLSSVKQLQFAFGRAREPVAWGGRGSWPARFVFLIAVPATDAVGYLAVLASLARLGQSSAILSELDSAPDAASILAIFKQARLRNA